MHLVLFSAVKNQEFLYLHRCSGLPRLSGDMTLCDHAGLTYSLTFFLVLLATSAAVKMSIASAWTICHLLPLHLPALPEADGSQAPEMNFQSCLETPGGMRGFSVQLFVADSGCY